VEKKITADEKNYRVYALCAVGAEKVVSNELKKLNFTIINSGYGKVCFHSSLAGLYRALIGLRAADRVLLEMACFSASDFDVLFKQSRAVHWEKIVPANLGFKVVKVRTNRSRLSAETSIQSIVHKAAAQRLCNAYGMERLPETGSENTQAEARVYIEKDMVTLLLDLSGQPLFKRGYRRAGGTAPLRETTAAALLLLSGWKRKYPLYDPFCGSGTILAEALLYAWDMAPGLGRSFALESMIIADKGIENAVRDEFRSKINFNRLIRIAGSDEDSVASDLAVSNLKRAQRLALMQKQHHSTDESGDPIPENFPLMPEIKTLPMQKAYPDFTFSAEDSPAVSADGFIVTNPPFGKRLGNEDLSQQVYREMPLLARNFSNWKFAVITGNSGFEHFFGKKANSCHEITGGPIKTYFFQYGKL